MPPKIAEGDPQIIFDHSVEVWPNCHKPGALLLQPENQGAKENEVKNCPFSIHAASASD